MARRGLLASALATAVAALTVAAAPAPGQGTAPPKDCLRLPTTADLRFLPAAQGGEVTLRAPTFYTAGCDEPGDPVSAFVKWATARRAPA